MPETDYYESSYRRDRERETAYSSDDDDRYKKTTVRRYKVGGNGDRVERVEKIERVERDEYKPVRRSSNNLLEVVDRRDYVPDRPRSAFEVSETRRTERDYGSGGRVVYEKTKEIDRYDRDRRSELRGRRDDDIVVTTGGYDERRDDGYGKIERWHRETEYYEPAQQQLQPIVAPIIVPRQQPGVVVIREKERDRERDRDRDRERRDSRHEDEYFYERRERHEVGPYRGDEKITTVDRYERRDSRDERDEDRPHRRRHRHRHRDHASDGEYDSDDSYYVKKTTVIRREASPDNHHRLHLAEGALAGAGLGALLGSRRNNQTGELPEHRGRKVLAGAALGALGTEVFKRAHSAYNERFNDNDDYDDRARSRSRGGGNRERSSSRHHSKLKTGLGIAAAALAVAGAAKYIQSNRIDKEERNRGRSLHRYSSEEDIGGGARSRSRPKSRAASVAKVAAGTAAVAGIVHHLRSKSRQREGKPARSHSRLRTGAEIAGAAIAGAAAKKLYDKHKDKKEAEREQKEGDYYSDDYSDDSRHGRSSRSHSHNRSAPSQSPPPPLSGATRTPYPPSGADPELGLVEYGTQPLYAEPTTTNAAAADRSGAVSHRNSYDSAADASEREDRRRRHRHRSRDDDRRDDDDDDAASGDNTKRQRSRSRLRNLAAAGAGAAAAAIGMKSLGDKKKKDADKKDRERERDRDRDRRDSRDDRDDWDDRDYDRNYDRDNDRRHGYGREDDRERRHHRHHRDDDRDAYDGYYDDYDRDRPASPPHASGGAFYPPAAAGAAAGATGGLMQHNNAGTTNLHEQYHPYNPIDYSGYPPPPGPPPARDGGLPGGGAAIPPTSGTSGPVPGPAPYPTSYPSTPAAGPAPGPSVVPPGPNLNEAAAPPPAEPTPTHIYEAPAAGATGTASHPPPVAATGRSDDSPLLNSRPPAAHDGDHVSAAPSQSPKTSRRQILIKENKLTHPLDSLRDIEDTIPDKDDNSPKAVLFAPLSPQSSRTLRRHHAETTKKAVQLPSPSPSEDDTVEELPNRFDAQGRPLDGGPSRSRGFSSRYGDFAFGNRVHGQWGVVSTDGDAGVVKIADSVRSILDGIGGANSGHPSGIMGIIGGVLEGLAHNGEGSGRLEDEGHISDDGKKRKRRYTYGGDPLRSRSRRDNEQDDRDRERDGDCEHERDRTLSANYTDGNYMFDRDGYDGHDARKRRRSWAS
ncbi:hypothetical protein SEUCBS139899_003712 [Sporothrix eucalyptigena]|uniref:DUF3824 domain-containing protein n=1 Tax=Sporothrix eucalyptigena TaxID=1812306 RepID=A0ABP0BQ57_9PEZI